MLGRTNPPILVALLALFSLGIAFVAERAAAQSELPLTPARLNSAAGRSILKTEQSRVLHVREGERVPQPAPTYRAVGSGIRRTATRHSSRGGFVPRHERGAVAPVHALSAPIQANGGEIIFDGATEPLPEGAIIEGYSNGPEWVVGGSGGCNSCGGGIAGGCATGTCGRGGFSLFGDEDDYCCLIPCPRLSLRNLQFFAGVQGTVNPRFSGMPSRGQDGSFGFNEGINWGFPFPLLGWHGLAGQLGFRLTQNNLSGSSFSPDSRTQMFFTGGLFRRSDWGIQGGAVIDYLKDDWYVNMEIAQLRGEVSWAGSRQHEIGFMFNTDLSNDRQTGRIVANNVLQPVTETWNPIDVYAAFYRFRSLGPNGGEGRIFGGFSGESDGLIGADALLPMTECWAFQVDFSYLIPQSNNRLVNVDEIWNVGVGLVFYPGGFGNCPPKYHRPLFNVGHNGSFFINRN